MKLGFLGALTLLFIGLKLAEIISWSWWLVLLPMYGPLLFVFLFIGLAAVGIKLLEDKEPEKDGRTN